MIINSFSSTYQEEERKINNVIKELASMLDTHPVLIAALRNICPGYFSRQTCDFSTKLDVFLKLTTDENAQELLEKCENYHPRKDELSNLIYTTLVHFQTEVPSDFKNWQKELKKPFPSHLTNAMIQKNTLAYAQFHKILCDIMSDHLAGFRIGEEQIKTVVQYAEKLINLEE